MTICSPPIESIMLPPNLSVKLSPLRTEIPYLLRFLRSVEICPPTCFSNSCSATLSSFSSKNSPSINAVLSANSCVAVNAALSSSFLEVSLPSFFCCSSVATLLISLLILNSSCSLSKTSCGFSARSSYIP